MNASRRQLLGAGMAAALATAARKSGAASVSPKPGYGTGTIGPKLKLSLAAYSLRRYLPRGGKAGTMTMHDFLDLSATWGLGAVEPTSYFFSSEERDYLISFKSKAFQLGLDISGTAVGNNFCLPEAADRKEQIEDVKRWVDHSVTIGAPVIRVFCGRKPAGIDRAKTFTWAVDNLKAATDYAASHGIFLAIENHGYLTEGAEDVLKVLEAVDHEWLGINLDTGNFDSHPYRDMAVMAPKATNVQVKVKLPTEDGSGKEEADLNRIVRILREANYRGYIALEYEGAEEPLVAIPRYLDALRAAFAA